jgi:hypothetical protein
MDNIPIDKIAKCYTFLTIIPQNHTIKYLHSNSKVY